ncbi:MAG: patatin-like phospholipase family protein [Pseudomonadota bacterium]|nr:patatin-like phospholipase family protein [Pseudomonadota bacterium]MDE3038564.1 patatin-like phospholipase family protein [Pseudomonadota bacterium]
MTAKKINLALQGGGAHGAYTWGVLDRLLEEEDVVVEGISGTSAGAMNAAMLVSGYMNGGRDGAKEHLETFWRRISEAAAFSPLHKTPLDHMLTGWNMDFSPAYHWFDLMSRIFSPYELNPLNINPMRGILEDVLDHEAVRACSLIKLFISATHVASGQARIFECHEITPDVLLASSCIPFMFQAVEIDGQHYWDGGYMGNPAIWPLIYHCESEDVVLVQINPIHDNELPKTANEIINRLNEISFNTSLISEMRAIDFVSKLLRDGSLNPRRYKDMRVHVIYSADHMHHLNASSKMNADWDFFLSLKEIGRECANRWLKADWKNVGVQSTIDIRKKFLCGPGSQPDHGDLMARAKTAASLGAAPVQPLKEKSNKNKQQQVKKRKKR